MQVWDTESITSTPLPTHGIRKHTEQASLPAQSSVSIDLVAPNEPRWSQGMVTRTVPIAQAAAACVHVQLERAWIGPAGRGGAEVGPVHVDGGREGDVLAATVEGAMEVDMAAVSAVDVEVPC